MARPTTKARHLPPPADDEDITDVIFEDEEVTQDRMNEKAGEFFDRLNEAGKNATLLILRQPLDGKSSMEHVEEVPVDRYEWGALLEYLRKTYGGGEYRFQLRWGGRIRANTLINIARPVNPPAAAEYRGGDGVVQAMLASLERVQQQLLTLSTGGGHQAEMQFLEKMKLYKELLAPAGESGGGFKQMQEMLGFFEKIGIGFERDQPKGLEAFAPVIGQLLEAGKNQPQTALQNPAAKNQGQNPMLEKALLQNELKKLATAAAKNSDPGVYAHLIVDQYGAENATRFLLQENAQQKIYDVCPALSLYPHWLHELGEHVKAIVGLPSTVSGQYQNEVEPLTGDKTGDINAPNESA